ncbi:MAG: hypothetical protein AAFW60_05135 [Pseudomonadota bacterium]
MLALQLLASLFLLLSAALCFGPRLAVYGPRAARDMVREGQVQFVAGWFASVFVLILTAPHLGTAFTSGGSALSIAMLDIYSMQFSLV